MTSTIRFAAGALCALATVSTAAHAALITFEDLGLPTNSEHHDSPFTSGGVAFNNADFGFSWAGFAYSSRGDTTTAGFNNQYSSIAGGGSGGSGTFAVGYTDYYNNVLPTITLPAGLDTPSSLEITNITYPALSMRDGDGFAKKFGGASGNDPDYFRLTIQGLDSAGHLLGSVDFYLADYRFANNAQDYIVNNWRVVDLSSLGSGVSKLVFGMASSDAGEFGINTPTYFAVDNVKVVPEPSSCLLAAVGIAALAGSRRRFR